MNKNINTKTTVDNRPILPNSNLSQEQIQSYLSQKKAMIEFNIISKAYPPQKTLEQLMQEIKFEVGTDEGIYLI